MLGQPTQTSSLKQGSGLLAVGLGVGGLMELRMRPISAIPTNRGLNQFICSCTYQGSGYRSGNPFFLDFFVFLVFGLCLFWIFGLLRFFAFWLFGVLALWLFGFSAFWLFGFLACSLFVAFS